VVSGGKHFFSCFLPINYLIRISSSATLSLAFAFSPTHDLQLEHFGRAWQTRPVTGWSFSPHQRGELVSRFAKSKQGRAFLTGGRTTNPLTRALRESFRTERPMLSEVLIFLKDHLNAHLTVKSGVNSIESVEPLVGFIDGEKMDSIGFKINAVSALLINVEEEKTLRTADPYLRSSTAGGKLNVQPDIRLNLYVLFVARFKQYEQGLSYLSLIIRYFQNHRIFNHQNAPALSEEIEQLVMELTTLPLAEQNDLWNALRTTYHPSVLYKVKTVIVSDDEAQPLPAINERDLRASP